MTLVVEQGRFLHSDQGAFVSADEACLVDPGILGEEVATLVARLGGAEKLGPEHLPPVTVLAHASFGEDLDAEGIRGELGRLEEHAGVARDRPFEPLLPDRTFRDETVLEVGDLELRLVHAPGHAASMLTVYEPEEATLWAADVLSDVEIPSVVHDVASYEQTLERLARTEIRSLVPGHGSPTLDRLEIARRLDGDRRYVSELRSTVTAAVATGSSLEETVRECERFSLRRAPQDDVVHRLNVEKVYADLGGDADPAQVGFAGALTKAMRS